MKSRPLSNVVILFVLSAAVGARPARCQGYNATTRGGPASGIVETEEKFLPDNLTVQLHGAPASRTLQATVDSGGHFQFDNVEPGQYELRLVSAYGMTITRDVVLIAEHAPPLVIRLPRRQSPKQPDGVVSLKQLQARTSRSAVKELARAARASEKSDAARAICHLKRSIEIAPDFLEAHNNLGVQYLVAGRSAEAIEQFHIALRLNPRAAVTQANLALALYATREFPAAETAAREAMSLEPDTVAGQYALALSLEAQGKSTEEALQHLARIADRFPKARMVRARMLAAAGQPTAAEAEVRTYLATAKSPNREEAQKWLHGGQHVTPPARKLPEGNR